jgi:hypothetical protein
MGLLKKSPSTFSWPFTMQEKTKCIFRAFHAADKTLKHKINLVRWTHFKTNSPVPKQTAIIKLYENRSNVDLLVQ